MTGNAATHDDPSVDAPTRALIDAAHKCEPLPDISDYLPFTNLGAMWSSLAGRHGNRPWLGYYPCETDDESARWYTYAEFAALIERVAALLSTEFGIRRGGSVATLMINQPLTVATYFAAWRIGARVVPVNPAEGDDRVTYIVENSGATLLLAHVACRTDFSGLNAAIGREVKRAFVADGEGAVDASLKDWVDFNGVLETTTLPETPPPAPDLPSDVEALVVYTSGTTGQPKGVVLTQRQMLADAHAISAWHDIDEHTVMMNVLPIHHVNGTVVTLLTPAFAGASVVVNRRFRSGGFWRKLAEHDVAIVSVVPTLLQFLLESKEDFEPERIPNFRHFICGAGPLSVELARDFQDHFGLKIVHGYGLSETVCYSCFLPPELPWHEHNRWMYDHGFPSIGVPVATNEMAIHGGEGRPVADGERGEIVIRGHNIMKGYLRNPEANATAFAHGWFRSGDEGFKLRGEDGNDYYFITGRIKELIIRGGINISPFEIDEVLAAMPGVRVGLAVGFDNRYYGEEVGAYVQREPGGSITDEDVLSWCREKLPASKCPKVVVFGDDIPVTSTGKYQRGKLKHLFEAFAGT
ncbi:MAG: class I adenylate-forming enzyme family protein, partial [Planctomycetota bacterium]|nr:class I adenylate-forming enzyme family protein [Planctomycetota bacterium]